MPNVLITAGPTREYIDPVRYISNKSSGKMGFAVAEAFAEKGAEVKVITGPIQMSSVECRMSNLSRTKVETAEEMRKAVFEHFDWADIIIMAAAVADYQPAAFSKNKIKKNKPQFDLLLERTPDILAELGRKKRKGQILVGFALETENLVENAKEKLQEKNLDLIIANDEKTPGAESASFIFISKDSRGGFETRPYRNIAKNVLGRLLAEKLYTILY